VELARKEELRAKKAADKSLRDEEARLEKEQSKQRRAMTRAEKLKDRMSKKRGTLGEDMKRFLGKDDAERQQLDAEIEAELREEEASEKASIKGGDEQAEQEEQEEGDDEPFRMELSANRSPGSNATSRTHSRQPSRASRLSYSRPTSRVGNHALYTACHHDMDRPPSSPPPP